LIFLAGANPASHMVRARLCPSCSRSWLASAPSEPSPRRCPAILGHIRLRGRRGSRAGGANGMTRPMAGGPVTVLFTDLVSSTAILERVGDEQAQRVLRGHRRLLQDALATHGGAELKWLGDGLMAVFPSTADAVRSAVTMQQTAGRRAAGGRLGLRGGLRVGGGPRGGAGPGGQAVGGG